VIPSTSFGPIVDGKAWLAVAADPAGYGWDIALDRPCDTCDGTGVIDEFDGDDVFDCDECDGTGRHTFDIEVENDTYLIDPSFTYRVSVVPGMVLPIYSLMDNTDMRPAIFLSPRTHDGDTGATIIGGSKQTPTTLPPAAKPGMWAVQVEVHRIGASDD
jgi:hypothetical protein